MTSFGTSLWLLPKMRLWNRANEACPSTAMNSLLEIASILTKSYVQNWRAGGTACLLYISIEKSGVPSIDESNFDHLSMVVSRTKLPFGLLHLSDNTKIYSLLWYVNVMISAASHPCPSLPMQVVLLLRCGEMAGSRYHTPKKMASTLGP